MDEIKKIISASYYTQPLMIASALVAFVIGFIYRNKFRELKFLFIYPMASILQILSLYYAVYIDSIIELESLAGSIFIVVEFILISNFFYKVISIKVLRTSIQLIFIIFMLYLLVLWTSTNSFYKYPYKMYLPQSLCILCFCFLYLFQLFKLPPKLDLVNNAPFWITIGCLFYFSSTIPLFFMNSILIAFPHYHNFYSINFFGYSILFFFLSKAFLCAPVPTK